MKLLTTNYCTETATVVTASSSDPSFPVSNLKKPFRSHRWRSTGVTSESVVFDFATTEPVDSVVILWPREDGIKLTGNAVIKIQANATNVWTSPAVDQVLTIDNNYSVASHYFSTDQNYRYWRVVVEDAGNPWDFVEIGVVWIGKSLAVENAQNGFKFSLSDSSKVVSTDYGHVYADEYPTQATLGFSYAYLDYDAVVLLENAYRRNGNRKPVLVVVDPTEEVFSKDHYMIYGRFTGSFGSPHVIYNLFNSDLTIEEIS